MGKVPDGSVRVEFSRSGEAVFLRNGRYLDSRYNPSREAEKRAAVPELAGGRPVVLFGDGGYYLAGLLAERGLEVVVVEPDPALAAAVLRSRGPEALSGFSLVYCSRLRSAADIRSLLPDPKEAVILEHAPTVQDFPEERERFALLLRECLQRDAAESVTTAWFGRRWLFNILANLTPDRLSRLVPQQSGAALIAVPGPTLMENRDWLRRNRKSYCLIALAPALPCLEAMGLQPDLVCATDGAMPISSIFAVAAVTMSPLSSPCSCIGDPASLAGAACSGQLWNRCGKQPSFEKGAAGLSGKSHGSPVRPASGRVAGRFPDPSGRPGFFRTRFAKACTRIPVR